MTRMPESHMLAQEIANRLLASVEEFADTATYELGFPVQHTRTQILYAARSIRDLTRRNLPALTGEVAFLFPSNTEGAMPAYLLALAAASGLTVHARLSGRCAEITDLLSHVFAAVPEVNLAAGHGADFLKQMFSNTDVRVIQIFGDADWIDNYRDSARTSRKTVLFDGPGHDPFIVLKGANPGAAVSAAVEAGLFAGGAACMSAERFYVQDTLFDSFVRELTNSLRSIEQHLPHQPEARIGLIYSPRVAHRLQQMLDEAKARGASFPLQGKVESLAYRDREFHRCPPIIVTNLPENARLLTEETFGPVFPIMPFHRAKEGLLLASRSDFGLSATVFGPPGEASAASTFLRLNHALVYVNKSMVSGFRPSHWASGGFKRSGFVWETGEHTGQFTKRTGRRSLLLELQRAYQPRRHVTP
jgi:acyl-CoA reductase-like NAD-dependent aldehyde dehydrogenase